MAQTVGEHTFYSNSNMVYGKAMESAKSNALMRCCKDLGVASELWDPQVNSTALKKLQVLNKLFYKEIEVGIEWEGKVLIAVC